MTDHVLIDSGEPEVTDEFPDRVSQVTIDPERLRELQAIATRALLVKNNPAALVNPTEANAQAREKWLAEGAFRDTFTPELLLTMIEGIGQLKRRLEKASSVTMRIDL